MTRIAFGQAHGQILGRRPQRGILGDGGETFFQQRIADQPPRVQQAGEHARVLCRECTALHQVAHRVTDLQPDVPQGGKALFKRTQSGRLRWPHQRQQIHIRMRKQQPATKAAHGKQCRTADITQAGGPHMHHDALHRFAASPRQRGGIGTISKGGSQRTIDVTQQLPQRTPRIDRHP
jgi:hypothetical protein